MDAYTLTRIKEIPKVELHLHLEGAARLDTVRELLIKRGFETSPEKEEWTQKDFKYQDLKHFLSIMPPVMDKVIQRPEDYNRIAQELFIDLSNQNVRYAEVSFDLARGLRIGIPFDEILSAIVSARSKIMASHPIRIGLLIALNRHLDFDIVTQITQIAVNSKDAGIVGIDLHGDESLHSPKQYADAFKVAKEAGLGLRAHAGESVGPSSVWDAIESLGVSRIAHGVRAIEDNELIEYLIKHRIALDICPTSNFKLSVVSSLSEHPIRKLFDLGVQVTVNSDDPLFFGTSITNEYAVLFDDLGFTFEELEKITLNAVNGSFLGEEEKNRLRQEIENDFP